MNRYVKKYSRIFKAELIARHFENPEKKTRAYIKRLRKMYGSEIFREHNVYPTMNVPMIYAVIAMCLELKKYSLSDSEIIKFTNTAFRRRKKAFKAFASFVDMFPFCYRIAEKWNISDHKKRIGDGSITYDKFEVSDGKIEYDISKCMYVEMFRYYGIRSLCKIFCTTDVFAYSALRKHIKFVRHSDLSTGNSCHDEIFDRNKLRKFKNMEF